MSVTVKKKFKGKISSSVWSVASNLVSRGITFIFTPIFTRLLSPDEYGIYSLYVSLMGLFTVITTFEISGNVMYRGLAKFENERQAEFMSSALGAIFTLNISFLALYIIFREWLNDITSLNTHLSVFLFIQVFLNAALGIYFSEKRYSGDYRSVALVNIAMGTVSPLLALLFIYLGGGGESRIIAPLVSSAIFGFPLIYGIIKNGKKLFSRAAWKFIFRITTPMLPHYLSLSLIAQGDKIIIARTLGEGAVGKYSAAYSVGFMLSLITSGILLVLSPITMRKQKENKTEQVNLALLSSGKLICYATLLFLTVAPEIFYVVSSKEYFEAMPVIYPVALSVVFLFIASSRANCLIHYEKPALITKNSLISALVCIALNLALIKRLGYIGGAYATLASYFLLSALNLKTLKKLSGNALYANYSWHFWLIWLLLTFVIYLLRFSFFARTILFCAIILMLLPELKKYSELLKA